MPAPTPPKPQIVSLENGGAIIAWLGTYPAGTVFNTYWEIGTFNSPPSPPLVYRFSTGLRSRTNSVGAGRGIDIIPKDVNIYMTVTSFFGGMESPQSEPIFLSISNSNNADSVNVGADESGTKKLLKTDEEGRLIVITDPDAPILTAGSVNDLLWTTTGEILYVKRIPSRSEPVTI